MYSLTDARHTITQLQQRITELENRTKKPELVSADLATLKADITQLLLDTQEKDTIESMCGYELGLDLLHEYLEFGAGRGSELLMKFIVALDRVTKDETRAWCTCHVLSTLEAHGITQELYGEGPQIDVEGFVITMASLEDPLLSMKSVV
jgi:hypothetical protein